jgi:phosphoadenosine phosphosulfate reductase
MAVPTVSQLPLSEEQLKDINAYLSTLQPQDILTWALANLPNLYQTTAFGLTGLAITDMLVKLASSSVPPTSPPPLIFIDTLYHFPETLELKDEVVKKYGVQVHVFKPYSSETVKDFENLYGEELWIKDEDTYDFAVKVEPAQRAYSALNVKSVITGRRASQGGSRSSLQPLEVDSTGLLKLNPLFAWSFAQVSEYIQAKDVPTNKLLKEGYKSIGDWHSTSKPGEGEGERAGRWKGREKTECGLHKDYFAMKDKANTQASE